MVIFQFAKLQFAGRTWRVIRCYKQRRLDCIVKYLRWDSWICPCLFTYRWCMPVLCCLQKMWGLLLFVFFTSHGQHIILQCFTLLGGVFHMVISWMIVLNPRVHQVISQPLNIVAISCYHPIWPIWPIWFISSQINHIKSAKPPASQFPGPEAQHGCPRGPSCRSHPSRALRALRRWEARRGRGGRRRPWAP